MKSLRSKNENLKIWKWKAKEPTSELTKDQKMKTLWSENEILEKQNEKLKIRKWNPSENLRSCEQKVKSSWSESENLKIWKWNPRETESENLVIRKWKPSDLKMKT